MNEAPTKGGPVDRSSQARGQSSPSADRSVAVKLELGKFNPVVEEKLTRRFWIGTILSSPFQNITLGGTSFNRWLGNLHFDAEGEPTTKPQLGGVVPLDEDQVERVKSAAANRVFRWMGSGENRRALLLTRSGNHNKPYVPLPIDEPVGKYIYMIDVSNGYPPSFHDGDPETMID